MWSRFLAYAEKRGLTDSWSDDLAVGFCKEVRDTAEANHNQSLGWERHTPNAMKALGQFAQDGGFRRGYVDSTKLELPSEIRKHIEDFARFCSETLHYRSTTMRGHMHDVMAFAHMISQEKGKRLVDIDAQDLTDAVTRRAHLSTGVVANTVWSLRVFLRYLTTRGVLQRDLSQELPTIRVRPDARIPSIWEYGDIEKIVATVDRSSPKGKRDFLILLLAWRLGLRSVDIRKLCLDDILWAESKIQISQSKTGEPLVLPLLPEVGDALIEYLQHGRPETRYREVFLGLLPPFEPFGPSNNLHHIITYWRQRSGVKCPIRRHHGLHSLRHSLATRLLEQGETLQTIGAVLGHVTTEATRLYAKVNVDGLRSVAIDPEEVAGDL